MNLFDEIAKEKKDFPKVNNITKEFDKYKLNFYQVFSIVLFIIFFWLGIFLGNLFATCEATSYFYSDTCLVTSFNFSLMISVWFIGVFISIVVFAIGHIIALLNEISEKLGKFSS